MQTQQDLGPEWDRRDVPLGGLVNSRIFRIVFVIAVAFAVKSLFF